MGSPPTPFAAAIELVKDLSARVYLPKVAPEAGPGRAIGSAATIDGSRFCGPAAMPRGETWPACGHCRTPMELFLQLNSRDLPSGAGRPFGEGVLQLFYCTGEDCDGGWEAFGNASLVRMLPHSDGLVPLTRPGGSFPARPIIGWEPGVDFPNNEEVESLGVKLTEEQENALYERVIGCYPGQGDKLLGWPDWVQSMEYIDCPRCKQRMRYVFQIASEDNVPYMFGDSGVGHIFVCPHHPDVAAFAWACC